MLCIVTCSNIFKQTDCLKHSEGRLGPMAKDAKKGFVGNETLPK